MTNLDYDNRPGRIEPAGKFSGGEFAGLKMLCVLSPLLMLGATYISLNKPGEIIGPYFIIGDIAAYATWFFFALFLRKFTGTRGIPPLLFSMVVCSLVASGLILAGLGGLETSSFGLKQLIFGSAALAGIAGTILYFIAGLRMRKTWGDTLVLDKLGNVVVYCVAIIFILNMAKNPAVRELNESTARTLGVIITILRIVPYLFLFKVVDDCRKSIEFKR